MSKETQGALENFKSTELCDGIVEDLVDDHLKALMDIREYFDTNPSPELEKRLEPLSVTFLAMSMRTVAAEAYVKQILANLPKA